MGSKQAQTRALATKKAEAILVEAGCTAKQIAAWRLENQLLLAPPEAKQVYQLTLNFVRKLEPIPHTPITPTQLGKALTEKTGVAFSGRRVNQILIKAELQVRRTRESSKKDGKPKNFYALTKLGQKYGRVQVDRVNGGTRTIHQIVWFPTVADFLLDFLESVKDAA